jgi:trimethylamine:corrinoid methyltransferase-like protein
MPGVFAMMLAERLAMTIVFNLFDPELEVPIGAYGGQPTDLRHACWAWGSPRRHVFRYLNSRFAPILCGYDPKIYDVEAVLLETASACLDEQAAAEKMATGLLGALQGARTFGYAGVLCVDDVYSGTQFVMDVEMVNYIREIVESFNPPPDIINMEGLYEECRDVSLGNDTFISHMNTVRRFRNILPSSDLLMREKLRSWMVHRKLFKDRARQVALERIRTFEPYHLPTEKQRELDRIYAKAEADLLK